MSKSKKIQKRIIAKKAPLSLIDRIIYITAMVIAIPLVFTPMVLSMLVRRQIIFSTPDLIAYDGNTIEIFWSFPLMMVLIVLWIVPLGYGYSQIQPIFGNPKYKPSFYRPLIPTDPLCSKAFWRNLSQERKKSIKRFIICTLIAVLLTAPLVSLSLYSRKVILENDQFVSYNSFNQVVHSATIEKAERIEISVTRGKSQYGMTMSIQFEEESYHLHISSFPDYDIEETLEYMIYLKSYFQENECEINNLHWIDAYLSDFTASEQALICDLFDYTP